MPVFKYKTFKDAECALWNFNPDEKYFDDLHNLFIMAGRFYKKRFRPGITKYKHIKDLLPISK